MAAFAVSPGFGEIISAHAVAGLGVSDDQFDRGTAALLAFDGVGDPASPAGDLDLNVTTTDPMESLP
jgi:hypothetical protein